MHNAMADPRNVWDIIGTFALVGLIGCAFAILLGIIEGIATAILGPGGLLDRIKRR